LDVTSLSSSAVNLSDGTILPADLVICATGWSHEPTVKFLPQGLSENIGISTSTPESDSSVMAADAEIMKRFPFLKTYSSGKSYAIPTLKQPSYSLYHGIVPPFFLLRENLAYVGMAPNIRGFLVAEIQALWTTAFFSGDLGSTGRNVLPDSSDAEWQALLNSRFWRWRAPCGLGARGPDMAFEILPYVDSLLRELGLNPKRKGGWREYLNWFGVKDYKGIIGEWLTIIKKDEGKFE
jgi:hypothetical protein